MYIVNYLTRTWPSFPILSPEAEAPNKCSDFTFTSPPCDTDLSAEAWNSVVQTGLKRGIFTEVTQTDGGASIELQGHQAAQPTMFWVNAKTYLSIRLVIAKDGTAPGHTVDFEWL